MEAGTMSEIAKTIGQRVRNYRIDKGLSQEKLAELSGCHPTYIGQVERGEDRRKQHRQLSYEMLRAGRSKK